MDPIRAVPDLRRRFLVAAIAAMICLSACASSPAAEAEITPSPTPTSSSAGYVRSRVAEAYLLQVVENFGISDARFRQIGSPLRNDAGTEVYCYQVSGADSTGRVQAFVTVGMLNGEPINTRALVTLRDVAPGSA